MTNNFIICNADTDSISFCKPDGSPFSDEENKTLLQNLNTLFPQHIKWEDDGYYDKFIIIKSKNYIMRDINGKVTIKGSSIKDKKREKRLLKFIQDVIDLMLSDKKDMILTEYNKVAKEIMNIQDMSLWSKKITVTKSVLNPTRTNEQRIKDAIGDKIVQEGDKIYIYFKTKEELCMLENFNGVYFVDTYLEKLYKTIKIFQTILDIEQFPNYKLKKNKLLLEKL